MIDELSKHIIRTLNLEENENTYENKKIGCEFYIHTIKKIQQKELEKIIDNYYENKKMFKVNTNTQRYINSEQTDTIRITKKEEVYKLRIIKLKNRLN